MGLREEGTWSWVDTKQPSGQRRTQHRSQRESRALEAPKQGSGARGGREQGEVSHDERGEGGKGHTADGRAGHVKDLGLYLE